MTSLSDAWDWYQAARKHLALVNRLAGRHWEALPWEGRLNLDDHFRSLRQDEVQSQTRTALDYLGDLAIVVMFSVFESLVRDRVLTHFEAATSGTIDPVLRRALDATRDGLAEGSFYRILEAHKERGNVERNDLIEEVNQVRKYRNWVAHGRRGSQPDLVTPQAAYDRLQAFLAALGLV